MQRIYMDNAATTAIYPEVIDKMASLMKETYGNPSSLHEEGVKASFVLDDARKMMASSLGCEAKEIYFTSGGSEADNWAILGTLGLLARKGKKHVITTNIEHHAILHTLANNGIDATYVPVDKDGYVHPEDIENAIREDTALVSVMFANNEIGTIQPVKEIAEICKKHKVYFHTDAVQAVGHIAINVRELGIDMLSLSGHKFHGPKGVGALYIRKGIVLPNLINGGGQEKGKRAGTENFVSYYGMALALKKSLENLDENNAKLAKLRDKLIDGISKIERTRINGGRDKRLAGNVNACFEGIEGESLLLSLDFAGIAASSGSACTSGSLDPSHVLLALGLPHEIAHGSLRLSLSEYTTEEEVDYVLGVIPEVVSKLRDMSPVWERIINENK